MKKTIFLFVIMLLFQNFCFAQKQGQQKIDSLLAILKISKENFAKVNLLNAIANEFSSNKPDTSIYFAHKAIALAKKMNYKIGVAEAQVCIGVALYNLADYKESLKVSADAISLCDQQLLVSFLKTDQTIKSYLLKQKTTALNTMGNIFSEQGDYTEALKKYFASLEINKEIGNTIGIAGAYTNIGLIYFNKSNYQEALKYYFISLEFGKKSGNNNIEAVVLSNIGGVYYEQSNYPEALKCFLSSLKIQEKIGNKYGVASNYHNIGMIYENQFNYTEALKNYFASLKINKETGNLYSLANNLSNIGNTYSGMGNDSEALNNYLAALKIQEEIGDKIGIALNYNNIGMIYSQQGNYSEALKNQYAALKIQEETGDKGNALYSYYNLGNIYLKQKNNSEASRNMNMALSLAKEIGSLEFIAGSYGSLAQLDSAKGSFKKALEHYKLYIIYRDSIYNEKNTKKLVQTQMQYEFDKKEAASKAEQEKRDALAIKELQKQKLVRNGFVGGFAIVLLFAIIFFMQRIRISKEKKRSEELLLNILPSEVAEELKAKGSALAKQFDNVTVIFTDFKGFTQIAEHLTPVELVAEIDICFKAFDIIMGKYNIEKIKTIGDSYMAAGGLPVPNKTNAADVVSAALEIQQFMKEHLQLRRNEGKELFEMRIGIHTGPVVAGIVGVKKFAYDIWGDTVNIASRMESSGEAGKVNISGSTYEIVKDQFNCTYRGKIEAKNKGEVDMYFVDQN